MKPHGAPSPQSPAGETPVRVVNVSANALRYYLAELLQNSETCHAILEKLNTQTGEYRIVLQGVRRPDGEATGTSCGPQNS